jgi:hypothetical protein
VRIYRRRLQTTKNRHIMTPWITQSIDPAWDWAINLISGLGLPALYSIMIAANGSPSTGGALASMGGLAGFVFLLVDKYAKPNNFVRWSSIPWERPLAELLVMASMLFRLSLSTSQLFAQATLLDSDVGAGLCVAPIYILLCMQGTSSEQYKRESRFIGSVLTIVVTISAMIYSALASNDSVRAPGEKMEEGEVVGIHWYLLAITDTAVAVVNPWDSSQNVDASKSMSSVMTLGNCILRSFFLATLGCLPRVMHVLLGPQPTWLFVMHGALMVHSSMIHAGQFRSALQPMVGVGKPVSGRRTRSPQRTLMIAVSPAIAVGFTFQWVDPLFASCATLALLVPALIIWALQWSKG